jgi:hypothetical protein
MEQRGSEEITLARGNNVWHDNDKSRMQFLFSVEGGEIRPVVRDEGVIAAADFRHQLPVFLPTQSEEVDVLAKVSGLMRHIDERRVKAFVN